LSRIEPGDSIELMLLVNFEDKKPMAYVPPGDGMFL
jgi:hypothetical protein